jgi:cysteinyl-tRNA synthetase
VPEGKYSAWDERGLPTADGEGKPLSKNATKTAARDFTTQEKLHEEYLKWKAEENA